MTYKLDRKIFKTKDELREYCFENGYSVCDEELTDEDMELEEVETLNPENRQKSVYLVVEARDAGYHQARYEMVLTDHYHDRTSTAVNIINSFDTDENGELEGKISKEQANEYNKLVDEANKYMEQSRIEEGMTAREALEIMQNNDNNIR